MENKKELYKKLAVLQKEMSAYTWEKDGINRHQSYKYITEAQYKHNFRKALDKAGLIWKMETVGYEYLGIISDKMHLIVCSFKGQLIDPETGQCEEYLFAGSGADNGDKAVYKAITGAHKFFLASNFNVSEGTEEREDEAPVAAKPPVQPLQRAQIQENLTSPDAKANEALLKSARRVLNELLELDPASKEAIVKIGQETDGLKNISKKDCESLILKVSNKIEKIKKAKAAGDEA